MRTKPMLVFLLFLATALPLSADTRAQRVDASPGEKLTIDLKTGGEVIVRGSSRGDVEVTTELTGRDAGLVQVDVGRSGDGVRVTSKQVQEKKRTQYKLKLTVEVPDRFDIRFKTMGGDVDLDSSSINDPVRLCNQ